MARHLLDILNTGQREGDGEIVSKIQMGERFREKGELKAV